MFYYEFLQMIKTTADFNLALSPVVSVIYNYAEELMRLRKHGHTLLSCKPCLNTNTRNLQTKRAPYLNHRYSYIMTLNNVSLRRL